MNAVLRSVHASPADDAMRIGHSLASNVQSNDNTFGTSQQVSGVTMSKHSTIQEGTHKRRMGMRTKYNDEENKKADSNEQPAPTTTAPKCEHSF
jgi:hypothetical protein